MQHQPFSCMMMNSSTFFHIACSAIRALVYTCSPSQLHYDLIVITSSYAQGGGHQATSSFRTLTFTSHDDPHLLDTQVSVLFAVAAVGAGSRAHGHGHDKVAIDATNARTAAVSSATVWQPFEVQLTSSKNYTQPKPWWGTELNATFTHTSGTTRNTPGGPPSSIHVDTYSICIISCYEARMLVLVRTLSAHDRRC